MFWLNWLSFGCAVVVVLKKKEELLCSLSFTLVKLTCEWLRLMCVRCEWALSCPHNTHCFLAHNTLDKRTFMQPFFRHWVAVRRQHDYGNKSVFPQQPLLFHWMFNLLLEKSVTSFMEKLKLWWFLRKDKLTPDSFSGNEEDNISSDAPSAADFLKRWDIKVRERAECGFEWSRVEFKWTIFTGNNFKWDQWFSWLIFCHQKMTQSSSIFWERVKLPSHRIKERKETSTEGFLNKLIGIQINAHI